MRCPHLRVGALCIVGCALILSGGTARPEAAALHSLSDLLPELSCEWVCFSCGSNNHTIMEAPYVALPDSESAHSEWCLSGVCPAGHACGGFADATWSPFERALYAAGTGQARDLLARHPDRVVFNEARNALQILGCSDEVIASYAVAIAD